MKTDNFDPEEMITWSVSLAMMQIMILEKQLPPHKLNARKLAKVREAIFDLAKGLGKPLDDEFVNYVCDCWNETMARIQKGLEERREG